MSTEGPYKASKALQSAISALRDAENRLRDAAAKAAVAGAYDSIVVISRWAKTVQAMVAELNGPATTELASKESPSNPELRANIEAESVRPDESVRKVKKVPLGVPVFSRDADFLVKSARSRKTRDEYEHRAPAEVVFVVAECLADWRSAKKLLTTDQLLEAYSKRKGSVVAYQVYVTLGWMMQVGLVRRHGRSGYSVSSPSTISEDVQRAWAALGAGQIA